MLVEPSILDRDDGVPRVGPDLVARQHDAVFGGVQGRDQGAVGGVQEGRLGEGALVVVLELGHAARRQDEGEHTDNGEGSPDHPHTSGAYPPTMQVPRKVLGSIAGAMARDVLARLTSGAAEIAPEGGLEEKLGLERPLRVKFGVDPSRPDLTLGHTVVLRKLRQFQDAGHVAVLIVGDFTARIGDPSGESETRPMLSEDEVAANARTYLDQAGAVIDVERAEIHGNAKWGAAMDMGSLLRLASSATVAQMLEREDFGERHRAGKPISVVEFLYPLFQGFDSVAVEADVEL